MIDRDDLRLLGDGFAAAMATSPGAGAADAALGELGWAELLDAAPRQGAAEAFVRLGATGAAAGLVDDVVLHALGGQIDLTTAVVLPAAHGWAPPGHRDGSRVVVDGIVSGRVHQATRLLVPVADGESVTYVAVAPDAVHYAAPALDPTGAFRRATGTAGGDRVTLDGPWEHAVAAARGALAFQLLGASRLMLEQARLHALERVQFGRAIAGFQAVRHRLAEALVSIEGAAAVADDWVAEGDPLLALTAKSMAGRAARTTTVHAQQVLAGIGFTTDHEFHRSLKRVAVVDILFGSARALPGEIGRQLVARGGAPRLVEL